MPSILFVCLGNICRSPTAEGLFRHHVEAAGLAERYVIDSAGTGGWHAGDPPDPRAIATAAARGVAIDTLRGRQVTPADFHRFDLVLGMDKQNMGNLRRLRAKDGAATARLALFLEEALGEARDLPDPYYGNDRDFAHVFDLCDRAAKALLAKIEAGAPSR